MKTKKISLFLFCLCFSSLKSEKTIPFFSFQQEITNDFSAKKFHFLTERKILFKGRNLKVIQLKIGKAFGFTIKTGVYYEMKSEGKPFWTLVFFDKSNSFFDVNVDFSEKNDRLTLSGVSQYGKSEIIATKKKLSSGFDIIRE